MDAAGGDPTPAQGLSTEKSFELPQLPEAEEDGEDEVFQDEVAAALFGSAEEETSDPIPLYEPWNHASSRRQ